MATLTCLCLTSQTYFNGFRFIRNAPHDPPAPAMYNSQQIMVFFRMLTEVGSSTLAKWRDARARSTAPMPAATVKALYGPGIDVHSQVRREIAARDCG